LNDAGRPADLAITEEAGVRFLEGPPGIRLLRTIEDASLIVEACFSNGVKAALLYAKSDQELL
jgi:hypothetical protein